MAREQREPSGLLLLLQDSLLGSHVHDARETRLVQQKVD